MHVRLCDMNLEVLESFRFRVLSCKTRPCCLELVAHSHLASSYGGFNVFTSLYAVALFWLCRVLNHSFSEGITEGENSQHLSESSTSFSNEVPQLGETPLCAPDENSSSSSCYAGVDTGHGGGGGADDMSSTHGDGSSESAHSPSSVAAACVSEALVSQEGGSVFSQVLCTDMHAKRGLLVFQLHFAFALSWERISMA